MIEVVGFQSHLCTKLELDPGINIITGLEDSGKTALLRAVNWCRTNRPVGDRFRHNKDSSKETVVALQFADGTSIAHSKGKENWYGMVHQGKASDFTKVGNDVPQPVREALRLDEINIQEQFDEPYLIWLTSGELANVFNKLSGMEKFDGWQAAVSNGIKVANSSIRSSQAQIAEASTQISKYEKLPAVEMLVKEIDAADKKIASLSTKFNRLRQLYSDIVEARSKIEAVTASEEDCTRALELVAEIRAIHNRMLELSTKSVLLEGAKEKIAEVEAMAAAKDAAVLEYVEALAKAGICDRCYSKIDKEAISRITDKMING
jgi:exonuclease SbcC